LLIHYLINSKNLKLINAFKLENLKKIEIDPVKTNDIVVFAHSTLCCNYYTYLFIYIDHK